MKDIIITAAQIKKEIILFLVSLVAAIALNVYSIAKYKTDWAELLGQLHTVFFVALVIYLLVVIFRLILWGFSRLMQKNK
jgi:uncharacterized membrane protein